MVNDVVQARQLYELPLSESFSTKFRDCSMPTWSKNLVISSFCDIMFPARANVPHINIYFLIERNTDQSLSRIQIPHEHLFYCGTHNFTHVPNRFATKWHPPLPTFKSVPTFCEVSFVRNTLERDKAHRISQCHGSLKRSKCGRVECSNWGLD